MSDPAAELYDAVQGVLRADSGLCAIWSPNPVRLYDIPPPNAPSPYIVCSGADVLPNRAQGYDGAEAELTVDVWSLTSPPGLAEARAIAARVQAALQSLPNLPSHVVTAVEPIRTRYLVDPGDGLTAHAVVTCRVTTDPL